MLKTERHEVALNRKTTDRLVQDHKQLKLIAALLKENHTCKKESFYSSQRESWAWVLCLLEDFIAF